MSPRAPGQQFLISTAARTLSLAKVRRMSDDEAFATMKANGQSLPFVAHSEAAGIPAIIDTVAPGSTIYADEASYWDALHAKFLTKRINHSVEYANGETSTNWAESFFSRLHHAEIGTHHHFAGRYLSAYANEMAWREDNRRDSNGEQYLMVTGAALALPVSRVWKGYWQRAAA